MSRRYAIEHDEGAVEVWIPSQPRIPSLFIAAWLLVYSIPALLGGTPVVIEGVRSFVSGLSAEVRPLVATVFYLAWLGVGVGPAVAGVLLVAYQFLGWERVRVDRRGLSVRREVVGIGWRRRFRASEVSGLRQLPQVRLRNWFVATGTVAFDHKATTYRFGGSLTAGEAGEVLRVIEVERAARWRTDDGDG